MARTPPHPILARYYQRHDDRQSFVTGLFDRAARHYDRVGQIMALGSGAWYRRRALEHAGLRPGMTLLDAATGTGQVARAATRILREPRAVIGLDPNANMLGEARKVLASPLVCGTAEALPFADERFDLLSMGYALRHVVHLEGVFAEYLRVLRPGGRLLLLEISRPRRALARWAIRVHFQHLLPLIVRISTRSMDAGLLVKYYWDTIDTCVPPETIVDVLRRSGFVRVERRVFFDCLSEYVGEKPAR